MLMQIVYLAVKLKVWHPCFNVELTVSRCSKLTTRHVHDSENGEKAKTAKKFVIFVM